MKLTLASFFLGLALIAACVAFADGQTQPSPAVPAATPNAPAAEPMGEDERIPFMQQNPAASAPDVSTGGLMLKTIGSMIIIVGLIFAGAWLARKFGLGVFGSKEGDTARDLSVLNTVSLGAGRTVSTIRFGERLLLVGSTPNGITLLAEEDKPVPVTRSVAEMLDDDAAFASEFARASERLENTDGGHAS